MSRSLVVAYLCALALPIAVLARQAEAAEQAAATRAELASLGGTIDPVPSSQDTLDDSIATAHHSIEPSAAPSFLDGLVPATRLDPLASTSGTSRRRSVSAVPPPPTTLRRLCWLQVFRD